MIDLTDSETKIVKIALDALPGQSGELSSEWFEGDNLPAGPRETFDRVNEVLLQEVGERKFVEVDVGQAVRNIRKKLETN